MTLTSTSRQQEWRPLFAVRGCPNDLIRRGRELPSTKSRAQILKSDAASNITNDRVLFITTFHPSNLVAEKIITRNFRILREDSTTRNIFNKQPLKAFRRAKNLKGSASQRQPTSEPATAITGTFPCDQVTGPFAAHSPCKYIIHNHNTKTAC